MSDEFYDGERDESPGDDISGDSMGAASGKSAGCPFCSGGGWATIFHMHYTGEAVIEAFDGRNGYKRKVMRTVAHCVCAVGRKMMFLHKESSKDEYIKIADLYDIVNGRFPEWQTDDPTLGEPMTAAELANLPKGLRDALKRMRGDKP